MCTFAEVKCGGFEALAASGYLQANITNTGVIPASYTLSVTNCSINIAPVPAQKLAILAGDMIRITPFQITVSDDSGQTDRYCWLVLYDSQVCVCLPGANAACCERDGITQSLPLVRSAV